MRTWDILTGLCKASFQTPVKDSDKRDARLINGKLIFGWYADEKIKIWDAEKGELLLAIDGPSHLNDLKMSEDGSRVFCLCGWFIEAWSIQTGENVGRVFTGPVVTEPLSVDNSKVWAQNNSHIYVIGWDFGTPGSSPVPLPKTHSYRLHPNGIMLWDSVLHRVEDTSTGKVVFQLPKRYGSPLDVRWNGQYLVACFSPTEVLILDFSHILK